MGGIGCFSGGGERLVFREWDTTLYGGQAEWRIPWWNVQITARKENFLGGDKGITLEATRFFNNTDVGFFAKKTRRDKIFGFRVVLPLYPIRYPNPAPLRVRFPENFVLVYSSKGSEEGIALRSGFELGDFLHYPHPSQIRHTFQYKKGGGLLDPFIPW